MNSTRTEHGLCDIYRGVLLGTAVGDALGLPAGNFRRDSDRRWTKCWDSFGDFQTMVNGRSC